MWSYYAKNVCYYSLSSIFRYREFFLSKIFPRPPWGCQISANEQLTYTCHIRFSLFPNQSPIQVIRWSPLLLSMPKIEDCTSLLESSVLHVQLNSFLWLEDNLNMIWSRLRNIYAFKQTQLWWSSMFTYHCWVGMKSPHVMGIVQPVTL